MNKKLGLAVKLVGGFFVVAVILLVVGVTGYWGISVQKNNLQEVGEVRLPSVESLLVISEAQTAVDSAENALLSTDLAVTDRTQQHQRFVDAKKRADDAWKIYEPLPQTPEEAAVWKKFVPAWENWWKDHEAYIKLVQDFETTITAQKQADDLYTKMSEQALVTNAKTFTASETLLNRIVSLYTDQARNAAQDDKAAFNQVAFWTIQSLLTISEAQSAIDSSENALLNREIDSKAKQEEYNQIATAWKRVDDAWKVYEPLEQSKEERAAMEAVCSCLECMES